MRKICEMVLLMVLAMGIAGCGETKYVQTLQPLPANGPTQRVGEVLVAKSLGERQPQAYALGQTNVEIMRIVIAVSMDEDARVEYIVPEFFSQSYGEALPDLLQNVRVIDQYGMQVGPGSAGVMTQQSSQYNGWQATTYAWLPAGYVIPKGTVQTFRIIADIPWGYGACSVTAVLPSWTTPSGMFKNGIADHLIVRGVASGEIMHVNGEVIGSPVYLYDPYIKG